MLKPQNIHITHLKQDIIYVRDVRKKVEGRVST